ncbi:MAG: PBP1A family penicillin-binding protein [Vallitalea sp.]|jgi:penicillin-binding protein 1A|nr:PBP1A family penicillin-binding protein [Vallitalea sp.]
MNYSKDSNNKKEQKIESKSTKIQKKISTSFIRIILFTIITILGLGVCAGIGVTKGIIDSSPKINFYEDIMPKGYTTFIYDQRENIISTLHSSDSNRIYASLDQIPTHLQDAFISIEDERFYKHKGIDFKGILRAIINNIKEKDLTGQGASTITQQIIKNNVLSATRTFERKIQEQYLAIELEKRVDKYTILESYLNTVALGRGTNGVQAASNKYFNKDVSELTIAESAVLASITRYPTKYDPITHPDLNHSRQKIVIKKMLDQGMITEDEYEKAIDEDVYSKIKNSNQVKKKSSNQSYFVDEVILRVKDDLIVKKGYTEKQAYDLIYSGGLSIYLTQDINIQNIVDKEFLDESNYPSKTEDYSVKVMYSLSVEKKESEVKHYYKEKEFKTDKEANAYVQELKELWVCDSEKIISENLILVPQPQASMVIIDYHTGHVKAIAGGRGKKIGNQLLNRATQTKRPPGSTFKILAAYLPAIDTAKYTLATVKDDVPFSIRLSNGDIWEVHNWYNDSKYKYNYKGLCTVRDAITDSINIHAVKTLVDVGIDTAFDYLLKLGFTTIYDSTSIKGKIYTDKNYPLALGGITEGVSLLELTAAYGAIANNGNYIKPIFYTKVLDHNGKLLLDNEQHQPSRVMKETTSFLLTDAMTDVIKQGTAKIVKFKNVSMPIAGKTGTSSNKKDLLFTGYTPYYVASIWQGYDTPKKQVYSRSYHKIMWRKIMEEIHRGLPRKEFKRPPGIVTAKICKKSGKLPKHGICDKHPGGSTIITEFFEEGTVPTKTCDVHVKYTICSESGLIANEYCPDSCKTERVFIKRPIPLIPSTWDVKNPPRIQDRKYEIPYNMIGEYCNIHGPNNNKLKIKLPIDFIKELLNDDDSEFLTPEEKLSEESSKEPYFNNDDYSPPPFKYHE